MSMATGSVVIQANARLSSVFASAPASRKGTPSGRSSLVHGKANRLATFTRTSVLTNKSLASRAKARSLRTVTQAAISEDFKAAVDQLVNDHKIVLFMKGTKQFPQCGFSNTCVQILNVLEVPYETVNILEDEALRSGMKEYSTWPTFPQVYMDGEFFGGCDIMIEAYQSGELVETVEKIMSE